MGNLVSEVSAKAIAPKGMFHILKSCEMNASSDRTIASFNIRNDDFALGGRDFGGGEREIIPTLGYEADLEG